MTEKRLAKRLAEITSPPFQSFLRENQDGDVTKLLLSKSASDVKEAANQIVSRRKAKDKLPDWIRAKSLVFPPPLSVEQSSSQRAAAYKSNLISGKHLVDLTGGMGVDCLALSKQFDKTTYVEQDPWLCAVFEHNQKILASKEISVLNTTAENYLANFSGKATFFIDPARRDAHNKKVFRFKDCTPDLTSMLGLLKEKSDQVLIKAAPLIDLTHGVKELEHVKAIHVLSIKNEVKEVLFKLDFGVQEEPVIHCVNLNDTNPIFSFKQSEEKETTLVCDEVKKYLYDPNSSILKAGGFKSVAVKYSLQKLSPNTHLYTSDERLDNFPGRRFHVMKSRLKKSEIKSLIPEGKVNTFVKNYPLSAEALKSQYKLTDGGDLFLIGYRDLNNKPDLLLCSK